jgi:hypothetical protein
MAPIIENMADVDLNTIDKVVVDFSDGVMVGKRYDKATLKYSFLINKRWHSLINTMSLVQNEEITNYFYDNFDECYNSREEKITIYERKKVKHKPS